MIKRHVESIAFSDEFGRQMRFIAGPRQTGKTTIAKDWLAGAEMLDFYYNWDTRQVKDLYRKDPYFFESKLYEFFHNGVLPWIVFDEIHKMPKWKNILKDFFDKFDGCAKFAVTGSARLDTFRKSGDSLAGRYFMFRLFPLVLSEVCGSEPVLISETSSAGDFLYSRINRSGYKQEGFEQLLEFGGFPEPFIKADSRFHKRWQRDYLDRLIYEDMRDLTRIIDLENAVSFMYLLPERTGSLLSLNSVSRDIGASYSAVKNCLSGLEKVYAVFLVPPYSKKISRSIKKEKKAYFFDWTRCGSRAARFENYVAVELNAIVGLWNDCGIGEFALNFVRTKDGKETDFLILKNGHPWLMFEVKLAQSAAAAHHYKHAELLGNIPFVQIVAETNILKKQGPDFIVVSASKFFA